MNVDEEIKQIDKAIGELVYPKIALQKAYNYYHGYRDPEQFKHIEDNYGIGTPTSITFNPLVRPHIDRLIGEYLGLNQDLKISCKDPNTISNIMREKQAKVSKAIFDFLKKYLENNIIASIIENKESKNDPFIEKQIEKIKEDVGDSFVSSYEIAAQNILKYIKQSKNIDMNNKMRDLLTDLCITGTAYYRVRPTNSGDNIQLEVLNPLNTFIERNPNSPYLADSYRSVVRRELSVEDIILQYCKDLQKEDIEMIKNESGSTNSDGVSYYVTGSAGSTQAAFNANHTGILGGLEVHPVWNGEANKSNYINYPKMWTVYDVEWIDVDYKTGKQTRHEGTRIGDSIYITRGESQYITRTKDDPNRCRLTVNGLFFLDKNGDPYSMIIKSMDLQDKYDLLAFYRDNVIANSGTVGDIIDLPYIPTEFGDTLPERLQKWLAYKKQGIAAINSAQEGAPMMNTIFNGFDDTVKVNAIQAIDMAMNSIRMQVSFITGVMQESLAQYEQRDAVANVKVGVQTTMFLTKQVFAAMDTIYKEVNYDMINLAKLVWPNGVTGTIILGNYSTIFTALPEFYTMTDFDVHIEDSSQSYQNLQTLVSVSSELIKGGAADLADITNIMTATSISEVKKYVDNSIAKKKAENDAIGQLQQQLQQSQQQLQELDKQNKELQKQTQKLQNELEANNKSKLDIENQKLAIEKEKVRNDKEYNDAIIEAKNQQIKIQAAEVTDENPYNNKIKAVV